MRFNALCRKLHYWGSAAVAIPLIVIICTGLLLQLKKSWTWVQPEESRGTGITPKLDLEGILASVRGVPEAAVSGWGDIKRIDVRPDKGLAKVWVQNGCEVQVDLGTGRVLHSAYRRSDLIESIHDGSFFAGDWTKLGVFLPCAIVLLLLWMTGLWMFWLPFSARRKRAQAESPAGRPAA